MNLKKTWKKLFSGILSLFVLASTLPVTAFATYDNTAQVYAMFKQESITGDFMSINNHFVGTVTPSARRVHWESTSKPINLWIYSDAMSEEEKKNGELFRIFSPLAKEHRTEHTGISKKLFGQTHEMWMRKIQARLKGSPC